MVIAHGGAFQPLAVRVQAGDFRLGQMPAQIAKGKGLGNDLPHQHDLLVIAQRLECGAVTDGFGQVDAECAM